MVVYVWNRSNESRNKHTGGFRCRSGLLGNGLLNKVKPHGQKWLANYLSLRPQAWTMVLLCLAWSITSGQYIKQTNPAVVDRFYSAHNVKVPESGPFSPNKDITDSFSILGLATSYIV